MNKLLKIRKFLGITQKQLADLLGVGQNTISQIENNIISLTDRNKFRLVEKLHVNLDWLDNDRGDIVCDEQLALQQLPQNKLPEHAETIIRRTSSAANGVPFISLPIVNGAIDKLIDFMEVKPDYKIDMQPFNDSSFYRLVSGESMSPKFKPADLIACKRYPFHNSIQFGEAYLCITKVNEQYFEYMRVIRRHEDDKFVILRALNSNFDDIVVLSKDIVELYIIKGLISRFV